MRSEARLVAQLEERIRELEDEVELKNNALSAQADLICTLRPRGFTCGHQPPRLETS